jgi:hypothetical protein
MKLSRILGVAIPAMILAPCAHAAQQGPAYAAIKAGIDFCARVDVEHRAAYETLGAKTLASVAGLGDASQYQATYDAVSASLKKLSNSAGRTQCAAAIGSGHNGRPRDR